MSKQWDPGEAADVVGKMYQQVLERGADDGGLVHYGAQLERGDRSVREIVKRMGESEEYRLRFVQGQTPEQAATLMYRHFLARAPESDAAVQSHAHGLENNGYVAEVERFVNSKEYTRRFGNDNVPA
jgi:phycoerythrin-associated linker protein